MNGPWRLEGFLEAEERWEQVDAPEMDQRIAVLTWIVGLRTDPYDAARPMPLVGLPWWFARIKAATSDTHDVVCSYRILPDDRVVICSDITSLRRPL